MKILKIIFLLLLTTGVKAQMVYKTPSGKKYHLANCSTVKNVSQEISLEDAVKAGLEPCKICNPPVITGSVPASVNKAQGQNLTVQCKGMTKSGTRCKHRTSIANGYCFQHQPK